MKKLIFCRTHCGNYGSWDPGWQDQQAIIVASKDNNAFLQFFSVPGITLKQYEDEIDKMEDVFHERHVHRVNSGVCSFNNTEHYVEILSNIERMGDHLENICENIINDEYCQYDEFNH